MLRKKNFTSKQSVTDYFNTRGVVFSVAVFLCLLILVATHSRTIEATAGDNTDAHTGISRNGSPVEFAPDLTHFLNTPPQQEPSPGSPTQTSAASTPQTYSLSLDGVGAYVSVPSSESLNVTGPFTVDAWIKTNSSSMQGIVERYRWLGTPDGGFALRINNEGKLQFYTIRSNTSHDYVTGNTEVSAGVWHHVAGVFDGNELRVYLDGALDGAKPSTLVPAAGTANLRIGVLGDGNHYFFNGLIDDARVTGGARYAANFTPERELIICKYKVEDDGIGCRGVWTFNNQTAEDKTSFQNHGTLVGAAAFSTETNDFRGEVRQAEAPPTSANDVGEIRYYNFDELGPGTIINNLYPDISFLAQGNLNVTTYSYQYYGSSPPNWISATNNFFNTGIAVSFSKPVDNLNFKVVAGDYFNVIAQVDVFRNYKFEATLGITGIGTLGHTTPINVPVGQKFDQVTSIVIHSVVDGAGLGYDDFAFNFSYVPPPRPAAPSNLRVVNASATKIDLAWTDNASTESEYKIERCKVPQCSSFTQIVTLPRNSTAYRDQSVEPNATYGYRVRAANEGGDSDYSDPTSATTTLTAPRDLSAVLTGSGEVRLRWSYLGIEHGGFTLERSANNVNWTHIANLFPNSREVNDSGFESGTTYYYRIRAYMPGAYSDYSNVALVTTPYCDFKPFPDTWGPIDFSAYHGWYGRVFFTENDGLAAQNIELSNVSYLTTDRRHLADIISVPYYTLETSRFGKIRGELKVKSDDQVLRSRLVHYTGLVNQGYRLYFEATFVIDRLPNDSTSCLTITQRYEFYQQIPGERCEPTGTLPCSRFRAIVKYDFRGKDGEQLRSINIAQRSRYAIDGIKESTVGLFLDCDRTILCAPLSGSVGFARKENPLKTEIEARIISNGGTGQFDNIHQTWDIWRVVEPGEGIVLSFPPIKPGCPECMHSHWRWGWLTTGEGSGDIVRIPSGSNQDVDLAIVRFRPQEESPQDYKNLLQPNLEPIRYPNPNRLLLDPRGFPAPESDPPTLPLPVDVWMSATGKKSSDTFFEFGGFFNPSSKDSRVDVLRKPQGSNTTPSAIDQTASAGTSDYPLSVVFANLYQAGATTYANLDPATIGSLPIGYTLYNNDAFEIGTTATASGRHLVTFSVPSVNDEATFNRLRILHAEPDGLDQTKIIWVERTLLAPEPAAPNYSAKTISSGTDYLGRFLIAQKSDVQPPPAKVADLAISGSRTPDPVVSGNNLTYTFNVVNSGPDEASEVHFRDTLASQEIFVSAISSRGSCTVQGSEVDCNLGTLRAGESASLSLVSKANEGRLPFPAEGKLIANSALVIARASDPNSANNQVTINTRALADPNPAPSVKIITPASGTVQVGKSAINFLVEATDSNGGISKVEFFEGEKLLGTGVSIGGAYFSFTWSMGSGEVTPHHDGEHEGLPGRRIIVAIATDNQGRSAISQPVNITINGYASVNIVSPVDRAGFNVPANITVSALASVPGGSISKVEFYTDSYKIGTTTAKDQNNLYTVAWANILPGTYKVVAVVTDSTHETTTSAPVSVRVADPSSVKILSPVEGQAFSSSPNIVLQAEAIHDSDDSMTVEFFANGSLIGRGVPGGASRYFFEWINVPDGAYLIEAKATDSFGSSSTSQPINIGVNKQPLPPGHFLWFDDDLPAGAKVPGDSQPWYWVTSNPAALFGNKAHQSRIASGIHQHYFYDASAKLRIDPGDRLFTYVFLDPSNIPNEIMLQWNDGSGWEHRAYWGSDLIGWGEANTNSRRYMGPIPRSALSKNTNPSAQWVRLEVPANLVGLEGKNVSGMSFVLFDGNATWEGVGKLTSAAQPPPPPVADDVPWIDDDYPTGAVEESFPENSWMWVGGSTAPGTFSGQRAHQSVNEGENRKLRIHGYKESPTPFIVNPGDILFTYVYLDPNKTPNEIMLQWHDGKNWEHRAFWGNNYINLGQTGTESRRYLGGLPSPGRWVRLEVPASYVGLEGKKVYGMSFGAYRENGNPLLTWDYSGKTSRAKTTPLPWSSLTRLYRFHSTENNGYYYYSTNEIGKADQHAEARFECYVSANQAAGTVPLYRLRHPVSHRYFYSLRPDTTSGGFVLDTEGGNGGIAGYVYPDGLPGTNTSPVPGTSELYLYRDPSNSDYLLLTDKSEAGSRQFQMITAFVNTRINIVPAPPRDPTLILSKFDYYVGWTDDSTNETGFKIEQKFLGSSTWTSFATVGQNVTKVKLVSKKNNACYRVRAFNDFGFSGYSGEYCPDSKEPSEYPYDINDPLAGDALPEITITSPLNGQTVGNSVVIRANAFDNDGNGTIAKVEFFEGSNKLGESIEAPYIFNWNGIAPGRHTLTAKATDSAGAVTTSAPVEFNSLAGDAGGSTTWPGLAAQWKFDEGSGVIAVDSSGNGNTGTLHGPTWGVDRAGKGALSFDGVDDYVSVAGNTSITEINNNFTVSFWAYPRSAHEIDGEAIWGASGVSGQKYAMWPTHGASFGNAAEHAGVGISVGTNGVSVYEHSSGYMPATLVYPAALSGWTHVAVVYENRQPQLYINGVMVKKGQTSPYLFIHPATTNLGGGGYGYFDGLLDDVRVYNKALSASEIAAGGIAGPRSLIARASFSTRISISWQPPPGGEVHHYELQRSQSVNGSYITLSPNLTATSFNFEDNTVISGTAYVYRVRAVYADGSYSNYSNTDLATAIIFSQDPIRPGETMIYAKHLTELRQAVNAVRALTGLSMATWSQPTPASGLLIKAAHVEELRANLDPALAILGIPPSADTVPSLAGLSIKAAHIQEIRNRVK